MTHSVRVVGTAIKLAIAAIIAILLFVVVINAIRNPVDGAVGAYTADFTDVSGLHIDGDVRNKGVLIGKVKSIKLVRRGGQTLAEVGLTLQKPYELTANSVLAVKYQNLTGVRYVDLAVPQDPGGPIDHMTADKTKPSFDITQLFNGLQPVLNTMSTDEVNKFTQNAISLLQGDGGGLAPMLDSVQTLANYAHDREQVISVLTANLNRLAGTMGGKSSDLIDFLHSLAYAVGQAMTVLDLFNKTADFGPGFTRPIDQMLIELGLSPELNIDKLLSSAFSSVPAAAESLRLLPGAFAGLQVPALKADSGAMSCSNGLAKLPTDVKVLLNGSEVVICNPH
ncbi:MlaD family protein [Nocardia sp. NPDC052278]|uniref:MlaD family protein n=1 Tax=unclassified Nocardia TaxID=2637762 RepID=UPI003681E379